MINTSLVEDLRKNQAYKSLIEKTNESQAKIKEIVDECLALRESPGLTSRAFRWAASFVRGEEKAALSITLIEKETIEQKLKDLDDFFQQTSMIKNADTIDFPTACDLVEVHYQTLIKQWELLETLSEILQRKDFKDENSVQLQKKIHSLLKEVILKIGTGIHDPLLTNEEVVKQLLEHQSNLFDEISEVKTILALNIEKEVQDIKDEAKKNQVTEEKKNEEEKKHLQELFKTQAFRVVRWRIENKLAVQLQRNLHTVNPNNPLTAQREQVRVQIKKEHETLKKYKKELESKKCPIPEINITTQEVWMMSPYGEILSEKSSQDNFQEEFDKQFHDIIEKLKTKKAELNRKIAFENQEIEKLQKQQIEYKNLKNSKEVNKQIEIHKENINKIDQEIKKIKITIRYTVLKRTIEKMGSYQNQLKNAKMELPQKTKDFEQKQALLYLYQRHKDLEELNIEKPKDFNEKVWKKALENVKRQNLETSDLSLAKIPQTIASAKKKIQLLETEIEKAKVTYEEAKVTNDLALKGTGDLAEIPLSSAKNHIANLEEKLTEEQATLYLYQQYQKNIQEQEIDNPNQRFSDDVWKGALGELTRKQLQTSELSPSRIDKTIASTTMDIEVLKNEMKIHQNTLLLVPEKVSILNNNFNEQLALFEGQWTPSNEEFVMRMVNTFIQNLKRNISFGYLAEEKMLTPREIRDQWNFANLGYDMKKEVVKLWKDIKEQKTTFLELKDEFLEWAKSHPEEAAIIASNVVQGFAKYSNLSEEILSFSTAIKTKLLTHSLIKQLSIISPKAKLKTEEEIQQELRFRALSELIHYLPTLSNVYRTIPSKAHALLNITIFGVGIGTAKTFFDFAIATTTTQTMQETVKQIEFAKAEDALRFASYVDYVFFSRAYVDSALKMQKFKLSSQITSILESIKNPKQFLGKIRKETSRWQKRLRYSEGMEKFVHTTPVIATVGVGGLTTAVALLGGPITWGAAIVGFGLYFPFLLYTYPTWKRNMDLMNEYTTEKQIIREEVTQSVEQKKNNIEQLTMNTIENLRARHIFPEELINFENNLSSQARNFIQSNLYQQKKTELQEIAKQKLEKGLENKKKELQDVAKQNLEKKISSQHLDDKIANREREALSKKSTSLTLDKIIEVLRNSLLFENHKNFITHESKDAKTFRKTVQESLSLTDFENIKLESGTLHDLREEVSIFLYADLMNDIVGGWFKKTLDKEMYTKIIEETQEAVLKAETGEADLSLEEKSSSPEDVKYQINPLADFTKFVKKEENVNAEEMTSDLNKFLEIYEQDRYYQQFL